MNITRDLMVAVMRRWPLAAMIAAGVLALAAVYAFTQDEEYAGTASILFAISRQDPTSGDRTNTEAEYITTQRDVIQSLLVAENVAERVPYPNDATQYPDGVPEGVIDRRARGLRSKLEIGGGTRSNVLRLTVTDEDPERAALIANAFAETYLQTVPEIQANTAQNFASWLEARTTESRSRLEEAQQRLAAFQRESGAVGSEQADIAADGLRSLNTQLAQAEGVTADASARAGAEMTSSSTAVSTVNNLRSELASQRALIAQLSQTLGPNHREMIAARAQLSALQSELVIAQREANEALAAEEAAAARREEALRERVTSRRDALIEGTPIQSQLAVLQNEVDAAQREYETVRERLSEQFLLSQMSQANASLLDRAFASSSPVAPNRPVLLLLGAVLGGMLGVSVVVALEWIDPKVRTREGLEEALGLPVLADMTDTNRSRAAAVRLQASGDVT